MPNSLSVRLPCTTFRNGGAATATHGNQVTLMAWDPSGTRVVTGSRDGIVRVGP